MSGTQPRHSLKDISQRQKTTRFLLEVGYLRVKFTTDPISAAASILGILGALQNIAEARTLIIGLARAPVELAALLEELNSTEELLNKVSNACDNAQTSTVELENQIKRTKDKLIKLYRLVQDGLVKSDHSSKVARIAWVRKRGKVDKIRQEL